MFCIRFSLHTAFVRSSAVDFESGSFVKVDPELTVRIFGILRSICFKETKECVLGSTSVGSLGMADVDFSIRRENECEPFECRSPAAFVIETSEVFFGQI